MSNLYSIYCDESCHLQKDVSNVMVLGAITCSESEKTAVYNDIRNIKIKHKIDSYFEIKWTKVSKSKIEFYEELIEYFYNNSKLSYRGLVARDKNKLDHNAYNDGDYDMWYYKMYYLLLDPIISPSDEYRIFIDIKDTNGGPRTKKLHNVLCNNKYDFKQEVIRDIIQVNSHESEILQLTDLFNGILSYFYRGLLDNEGGNQGKKRLIEIVSNKLDLNKNTSRNEQKFNLFIWNPRRCS